MKLFFLCSFFVSSWASDLVAIYVLPLLNFLDKLAVCSLSKEYYAKTAATQVFQEGRAEYLSSHLNKVDIKLSYLMRTKETDDERYAFLSSNIASLYSKRGCALSLFKIIFLLPCANLLSFWKSLISRSGPFITLPAFISDDSIAREILAKKKKTYMWDPTFVLFTSLTFSVTSDKKLMFSMFLKRCEAADKYAAQYLLNVYFDLLKYPLTLEQKRITVSWLEEFSPTAKEISDALKKSSVLLESPLMTKIQYLSTDPSMSTKATYAFCSTINCHSKLIWEKLFEDIPLPTEDVIDKVMKVGARCLTDFILSDMRVDFRHLALIKFITRERMNDSRFTALIKLSQLDNTVLGYIGKAFLSTEQITEIVLGYDFAQNLSLDEKKTILNHLEYSEFLHAIVQCLEAESDRLSLLIKVFQCTPNSNKLMDLLASKDYLIISEYYVNCFLSDKKCLIEYPLTFRIEVCQQIEIMIDQVLEKRCHKQLPDVIEYACYFLFMNSADEAVSLKIAPFIDPKVCVNHINRIGSKLALHCNFSLSLQRVMKLAKSRPGISYSSLIYNDSFSELFHSF